jgi:hypothetical protein
MISTTLSLAFFLVTLSSGSVPQSQQSQDTKVIDKFISAQAAREKGEEPEGIRKTASGDLNHDGLTDVAVLYTIEGQDGSNNYVQYLAVFLGTRKGLVPSAHRAVGGKNYREVMLTGVSDGLIHVDTTDYGPKDPSCCPTKKGSSTFALQGRVLKERRRKVRH